MMDNKKILWFGSNGSIQQQLTPNQFTWSTKEPYIHEDANLIPVRILSTWSKTMSLIYVTVADMTKVRGTFRAKHKILNNISAKWE